MTLHTTTDSTMPTIHQDHDVPDTAGNSNKILNSSPWQETKNVQVAKLSTPLAMPKASIKAATSLKTTIVRKMNEALRKTASTSKVSPSPVTQSKGGKRSRSLVMDENGQGLLDIGREQISVSSAKRGRKSGIPTTPATVPLRSTWSSNVLKSILDPPSPLPTSEPKATETSSDDESSIIRATLVKVTTANVAQAESPAPQPMLFCCLSLKRVDSNCLFTCDNQTCIQRCAMLHLADELKGFAHAIPSASSKLLEERDYMIQVVKHIPLAVRAAVSTSRVKTTTGAASMAAHDGKTNWTVDRAHAGINGRFFLKSETGVVDKTGCLKRQKSESVWAEVAGMGMGKEGEERLRGYERMEEGFVEFSCEFHHEEKWICFYWVKALKA